MVKFFVKIIYVFKKVYVFIVLYVNFNFDIDFFFFWEYRNLLVLIDIDSFILMNLMVNLISVGYRVIF